MSLTELTQTRPTGPRITARVGIDDGEEGDAKGYLSVQTLRKKRNDYLTEKVAEIEEQREGRHYYHCAQHTAAEIEILRKRKQPIITYNLVGPKINGICGLIDRQRQDPKAYPRSPKHEEGADIATAAVRYVADANEWRSKRFDCLLKAGCEGIAGVELNLIQGDHQDPDISVTVVDCENFFYHVPCFRPDFSDSRGHGIAKWMEIDEAVDLFPDKEEELRSLLGAGGGGEFNINQNDRERKFAWLSGNRMLLVEHWYKHKGRWCWAFYVGDTLLEEGESPFFDEKNKSMSRFIMWSAAVDQDGDRYGYPRNLKGPQDEVNQRRSKALWTSVSRQAFVEKGAVDDIEVMRRELMRPDGIIEHNPGKKPEKVDQTGDMAAQLQFFQDAITYIQNFASTDAAAMQGVSKNLSGRAINLLQQPGIAQIGPFINSYRAWQLRVYRWIWCTAQRHWTSERWIRVTDDEEVAKFLQVNGMELDQYGMPVLVNLLGNLDVDIIMDEGPDVVSMDADVFDQIAADPNIPFLVKLEFMAIPGSKKRRVQEMMKPQGPPPPDPKMLAIQMKGQLDERSDQRKAEIEKVQAQADIATDQQKIHAEMTQDERDFQLKKELAFMEAGLEQERFRNEEARKDKEHDQKMELAREQARLRPSPSGSKPANQGQQGGGKSAPSGGVPARPHPGARKARDGNWYVPDPSRGPNKYHIVIP